MSQLGVEPDEPELLPILGIVPHRYAFFVIRPETLHHGRARPLPLRRALYFSIMHTPGGESPVASIASTIGHKPKIRGRSSGGNCPDRFDPPLTLSMQEVLLCASFVVIVSVWLFSSLQT